jgi:hypothetical protein
MGLTVAQMKLEPVAHEAALRLQKSCPGVQFTSGRRTMQDQARAMTANLRSNVRWIGQTYTHGQALQAWVDRHVHHMTWDELEQGLFEQLMAMPNAHQISRHLTGLAFDVLPMTDHDGMPTANGRAVMDFIQNELQPRRFLTREGGLIRWHVDFHEGVSREM